MAIDLTVNEHSSIPLSVEEEKGTDFQHSEAYIYAISPSAKVEESEDGATITIKDKDGETVAVLHNGKDGKDGADGAQGPKGDTGERGPQGIQGPQGERGLTGETGPQGPKGDTGADGPQGLKGDTGPQGPKGDKGDTGATGPKGDKGETGPAGSDASVTTENITAALGYTPIDENFANTIAFDVFGDEIAKPTFIATDSMSKSVIQNAFGIDAPIIVPSNATDISSLVYLLNPRTWFVWLNGTEVEFARLDVSLNGANNAVTMYLRGRTSTATGIMGVNTAWTVAPN